MNINDCFKASWKHFFESLCEKIITSIRNSQFPLLGSLTYLFPKFLTNVNIQTAA